MDMEEAKRLHRQGLNNKEISEQLGVPYSTLCYHFKKHGIVSNHQRRRRTDLKKRKALYDAGLNDREIAYRTGCNSISVLTWRRRRGLPANALNPAELHKIKEKFTACSICGNHKYDKQYDECYKCRKIMENY